MAHKFSSKFKAEAVRLLEAGVTTAEAQAQLRKRFKLSVSEGALRKWMKDHMAAPTLDEDDAPESAPLPPPPVAPEAPAADAPMSDDIVVHTRRQISEALRSQQLAQRDGNHTAASRYHQQVVEMTTILARLEKERKPGGDEVITISRADFDRADRAAQELLAALRSDIERTGGVVCANCGRELRIALAKGERKDGQ